MPTFFVRIGVFAETQIAHSDIPLERGSRVILRSARGAELGEVISQAATEQASDDGRGWAPLRVLRVVGHQDEMLLGRLDRHKRRAIEKCRRGLASRRSTATLLDIDHLFDGSSIVLHFLGEVDASTHAYVRELAADYESIVRTGPLAKLLSEGCGEGCGTSESKGCGGSCAGCSVAAACGVAGSAPASTRPNPSRPNDE